MKQAEEWWVRRGQYIDPDTDDVSWFDKRKGLAMEAFAAAWAQAGNYTANTHVAPTEILFANGRTVKIVDGSLEVGSNDGLGPNAQDLTGDVAWLWTHCRALGMTRRSDSGLMRDDVALYAADLHAALRELVALKKLKGRIEDSDHPYAATPSTRINPQHERK